MEIDMRKILLIFITFFLVFNGCSNNNELTYLEKQIKKQKNNVATECKIEPNFELFEDSLKNLKNKRFNEIDILLKNSSIREIQKYYTERKLSITETVLYFLKKFKRNRKLNTLISLNPELLKTARLQEQNLDKIKRKPLFGIPVLVKDNIAVENMKNTAGAMALSKLTPENDAHLIQNMKKAGAIIMGKANLSEWANFMTSSSSNGYSALGGQTQNPYGEFDVGGSSSGSAVAVSANLIPLAVGTETCGSLIYPASQNSVVTLKPTTGLISRDGIIPISYTQDTAGPMAKRAKDAAILFEQMVGYDSNDPKTKIAGNYEKKDPNNYLDKNFLKNKRIGLVTNEKIVNWYRKTDKKIIKRAVKDLENMGAEVVEIKLDESIFDIDMRSVYYYEFKKGVGDYLKEEGYSEFRTLAEIVEYNKKDKENRAYYGQDLLIKSVENKITEKENRRNVLKNIENSKKPLDSIMEENNLDFILTLSNYLSGVYAPAGYPAINVPAGYRPNGEPIGITFIAKSKEDRKLLNAGYSYEQHTRYREAP
ncbi:MAG: amidase [Candidatus Mcinerneyibacterium aminivorans]|uniref:Amidase n=1 Tax=Candidatus Mcinerneyibacterium aminivorans TaxID=2703815 RepID=A0A5D0MDK4_9BACT|nr:MAG: amidase [Candidatus Mcinerneyibacterium aminivorans]